MKIAVITGASRGLGRSMAQHLSRAGWGVVGTYRSSQTEADALVAELQQAGAPRRCCPSTRATPRRSPASPRT